MEDKYMKGSVGKQEWCSKKVEVKSYFDHYSEVLGLIGCMPNGKKTSEVDILKQLVPKSNELTEEKMFELLKQTDDAHFTTFDEKDLRRTPIVKKSSNKANTSTESDDLNNFKVCEGTLPDFKTAKKKSRTKNRIEKLNKNRNISNITSSSSKTTKCLDDFNTIEIIPGQGCIKKRNTARKCIKENNNNEQSTGQPSTFAALEVRDNLLKDSPFDNSSKKKKYRTRQTVKQEIENNKNFSLANTTASDELNLFSDNTSRKDSKYTRSMTRNCVEKEIKSNNQGTSTCISSMAFNISNDLNLLNIMSSDDSSEIGESKMEKSIRKETAKYNQSTSKPSCSIIPEASYDSNLLSDVSHDSDIIMKNGTNISITNENDIDAVNSSSLFSLLTFKTLGILDLKNSPQNGNKNKGTIMYNKGSKSDCIETIRHSGEPKDENTCCNRYEPAGHPALYTLRGDLPKSEGKKKRGSRISKAKHVKYTINTKETVMGTAERVGVTDLEPFKDTVFSFRIHEPFFHIINDKSSRVGRCNVQLEVLGSQTLADLRDGIVCEADYQDVRGDMSQEPNSDIATWSKDVYTSSMFYISDTFYVDCRNPKNIDYSEEVKDWAQKRGTNMGETFPMEEKRIEDLKNIRFGYPYLFMHQGNCEHTVIICDARLLTGKDSLSSSDYPMISKLRRGQMEYCSTCSKHTVGWIIYNSDRMLHDPSYQCNTCFKSFHYIDGRKIGNFKAYRYQPRATVV